MAEIQTPKTEVEHWLYSGETLPTAPASFAGIDPLGQALILSSYRAASSDPILVIYPSKSEAHDAVENLKFFLGQRHKQKIHYIPPYDFDFYKAVFPEIETLCQRNVALFQALNDIEGRIFVTSAEVILQKVYPAEAFLNATQVLSPNDEVDRDALILRLLEAGYQRQPLAYDPGVFSVRGGVLDVFTPLYPYPVRIEFFGDLVETIRTFDPQSQRSVEEIQKCFILPIGSSLIPHGADFEKAASEVKHRLDHQGIQKGVRDKLLEDIRSGILPNQLAFLFPLFSKGSSSIWEYFSKDTRCFWAGESRTLETVVENILPRYKKSFDLYEKEPSPIATFESLFLEEASFRNLFRPKESFVFEAFEGVSKEQTQYKLNSQPLSFSAEREGISKQGSHQSLLESFARRFRNWLDEGYLIHVVSHTQTHADRFRLLFEPLGLRIHIHKEGLAAFPEMFRTEGQIVHLWQGYITHSVIYPLLKVVVLSEDEIFGRKKRVSSSKWAGKSGAHRALSSFRDLKIGDYVVHKDHGIGKYLGLKSMNFLGTPNDYVLLEYKEGDKLYVPVYRLNIVQKYVGGEGAKPLVDKLGGDRWVKAKRKAQKAAKELAAVFLQMQAKRKLATAKAFKPATPDYAQFEMAFPFDETPDQQKAIDSINSDLEIPHPMDRLVVGDVGYGKTEVAMRAAYRTVLEGKQVALLVPTTILAFQHFENFKSRFKDTGAVIDVVSRLKSTTENRKTVEKAKEGKIDILVGTHRLLSSDIKFKDLGMVIVDEEHRFGVVHKEKLKKMSESVHYLTMTATPIPRTLNMAMTGIKSISLITTPPPDRLAVRTFVCRESNSVISEAISNELGRDGQVFFLHNRVETLFKTAENIQKLFPKVKLEVVHGQMDGDMLEKKMLRFYRGEAQILVTTSIIESGLDIPRANTIVIDKAHALGLAQLYQLRGRVGRSEKRAYCYLLIPPESQLTNEAKERLKVIQRYSELGAGFNVASHDMEIRGAGDLLGKEQSGHLSAVGVDMYFELLEEAVAFLQGQGKKQEIEPEINLKINAYFPHDYLPDVSERVSIYRQLSSVDTDDMVAEIEQEIRDRFGSPPEEVVNLLGLMRIKLHLKRLHVTHMNCGPKRISLRFNESTQVSPQKIIALIKSDPERYSVTPDHKLVFSVGSNEWKDLLTDVQFLEQKLVG